MLDYTHDINIEARADMGVSDNNLISLIKPITERIKEMF
jgi:hypothetical protein